MTYGLITIFLLFGILLYALVPTKHCFHCNKIIWLIPWTKCGSKLFCSPWCFSEWLHKKTRERKAYEKEEDKKQRAPAKP